jgi:hypothetical protein
LAHLGQESLSVDSVESLGEVKFGEHFAGVGLVALTPLTGGLRPNLRAEGQGHTYLERGKVVAGRSLAGLAEHLGGRAPQRFSHSDGPG